MSDEEAIAAAILKRDNLLATIEFVPVGNTIESPVLLDYLKDLNNITSQEGYPHNITWPIIHSFYDTIIN